MITKQEQKWIKKVAGRRFGYWGIPTYIRIRENIIRQEQVVGNREGLR